MVSLNVQVRRLRRFLFGRRHGRPDVRASTRRRLMISRLLRCQYCRRRFPPWANWEIDHIYPVARGGRNCGNLALACRSCNRAKGTQLWRPRPLNLIERALSAVLLLTDGGYINDCVRGI